MKYSFFLEDADWSKHLLAERIDHSISKQTKEMVASIQSLSRDLVMAYNRNTDTLDMRFAMMERSLDDMLASGFREVETSIKNLGAVFNYNMTLLLDELQILRGITTRIANKLDKIYKAVITPMRTRAREMFKEGCNLLAKGLWDKGLEYLHKAEEIYDADFFTHFLIGKIYLYGIKNKEINLINLEKAEKHLLLAVRYGRAEIKNLPQMSEITAEALLHLSITYYNQGIELRKTGKEKEALEKIKEARNYVAQATDMVPRFWEAHYHLAKYAAILGETSLAIDNLKTAILGDRNYCLRVDADLDFDKIRSEVYGLFSNLTESAKVRAVVLLTDLSQILTQGNTEINYISEIHEKLINFKSQSQEMDNDHGIYCYPYNSDPEYLILSKEISQKLKELDNVLEYSSVLSNIESLFKKAQNYYKGNTYFDYLDCISLIEKDNKELINKAKTISQKIKEWQEQNFLPFFEARIKNRHTLIINKKKSGELRTYADIESERARQYKLREEAEWRKKKTEAILKAIVMGILGLFIGSILGAIVGVVLGGIIAIIRGGEFDHFNTTVVVCANLGGYICGIIIPIRIYREEMQ